MEIKPNSDTSRISNSIPPKRPAPAAKRTAEASSFAGTDALNAALQSQPAARPEAVQRATALIKTPGYPDGPTLNQVARLLADHLDSNSQ